MSACAAAREQISAADLRAHWTGALVAFDDGTLVGLDGRAEPETPAALA